MWVCYVYAYSLNAGVKGGKGRLGKAKDGCFALLSMTSGVGGGTSFFNVSVMLSGGVLLTLTLPNFPKLVNLGSGGIVSP